MTRKKDEADQATAARGKLLLPAAVAALAFCALVGLGVWQLQRLAWKEALIAAIAERSQASPVPPPAPAEWLALEPNAYDYRSVTVTGVFEHDKEALVFRILEGGKGVISAPGFLALTPLRLADGAAVIVNRGFVPQDLRDKSRRAAGQVAGEVTVTGLMRPPEPRNFFTPADDPAKGLWYTRDPAAIARALDIARAAPFTIDADAAPNPGGWPQGGHTVLAIKNDHLVYALTWFGLALTLVAVFGVFVRRRIKGSLQNLP